MTLKISPADDLTPRKAPTIHSSSVILNHGGFAWREYLVRLPSGLIADDLKEPAIWRQVQTAIGLAKHDRLYLVSFDDTWVAEAIVASADRDGAVLAKPRLTTFPDRYDGLYEDDTYRVTWTGVGYCGVRKADGKKVTTQHPMPESAEREIRQINPAGVGDSR